LREAPEREDREQNVGTRQGATIGEAKARKLLSSLTLTDDSGNSRNCVFFIRGAASPQFWKTLESRTGRDVIFESEEARNAAQSAE
jgi:hypothetical protein